MVVHFELSLAGHPSFGCGGKFDRDDRITEPRIIPRLLRPTENLKTTSKWCRDPSYELPTTCSVQTQARNSSQGKSGYLRDEREVCDGMVTVCAAYVRAMRFIFSAFRTA